MIAPAQTAVGRGYQSLSSSEGVPTHTCEFRGGDWRTPANNFSLENQEWY
jgi:hypothetical protein